MKTRKISLAIFWGAMLAALLFAGFKGQAQTTKVGGAIGLVEQSNTLGVGWAGSLTVQQEIYNGLGVGAVYTEGFPYEGEFHQLQLQGFYQINTTDERLGVKVNVGVARQNAEYYPTFGLDILAMQDADIHPYLSWSPVVRGDFGDVNTGWSHTVQFGFLFKL